MLNAQQEFQHPRLLKAAALTAAVVALALGFSNSILSGDSTTLIYTGVAALSIAVLFAVLADWRNGVYIFFVWLVFEDLIRKYAGNGTTIFFAKDALVIVTYMSMLGALRRRQLLTFRPSFLLWFSIFFWFCTLYMFNPNSPSIYYGLLGLKTDFMYFPLLFAGYALLRTEEDLHKILTLNLYIAGVVTVLGIAQSVLGLSFLNPADMSPELRELTSDARYSAVSGVIVERGTSVYVSEARYAQALVVFFVFTMGTAGYFLLKGNRRGRQIVFAALAVIVLATIMAGSRTPVVALIGSSAVLFGGMMWGSPRKGFQSLQIGKSIRRTLLGAIVATVLMTLVYPEAIRTRWLYYMDTLSPTSSGSELVGRSWEYPIGQFLLAFTQPNWGLGNGTGTVSLGRQYVSRLTGSPPVQLFSEGGYSDLILEFGIIGPFLWTAWTISLLIYAWKAVRKLKGTTLFPIGFAFFWYAAYTLLFAFFYSMAQYQNYLTNAYLWLSVGMMFRLPGLVDAQNSSSPPSYAHTDTE